MTKLVAILVAGIIFLLTVELVRRERLTFKYAFFWLAASLVAVLCALFEKILFRLSSFLGFEIPSNFIFFFILSGLVFFSLLFTIFLCRQNSRNDSVAQKLAILELEVEKLKKGLKKDDGEKSSEG